MISTATKTLQTNNKTIYVAILSTLTFFLFLDYIPGLQAWSAWVTPPVALFLGGIWICLSHLVFGAILCITIIGIPFGLQHFKLAALALSPFGKDIVTV